MALIPIEEIRLFNGLHSDLLTIGMNLYFPPRRKYEQEGFSYITPSTPDINQFNVQTFSSINSYYGVFEYHILENGSLSTLNDTPLIPLIRQNQVLPLVVITNLTETGFNPELTSRILNNPELRQRVIDNIYNLIKSKNYAGVNIDFERLREKDRDIFSGFLRSLRERLKPEGYYTSVAVSPENK